MPLAFSLDGTYGVRLGLWMLDTLSSPLADVVTASLAVLPSDPGAPDGHSGISTGVWAAAIEAVATSAAASIGIVFIRLPLSNSENLDGCFTGRIGNAVSLTWRGSTCQNTGPNPCPTCPTR